MKRIFAMIVMLLPVFSAVSCVFDENEEYELVPGDMIPDFKVEMNDGTEVSGSGLRKGKTLIMFFHTDCPDCRNTLPSVQKVYDLFVTKGVKFALISRGQLDGPIREYWDSEGYTMPYSAQPDRKIYSLFASSRVPRVYICNEGYVMSCYHDDPIPSYDQLLSDIEALF